MVDESEEARTIVDGESGTRGPGSTRARDEAPPTAIGRYRVVAKLGSGGMGDVYRARDPELDRDVAVKIVRRPITGRSDAARERALREAQAMARLSHPNVVEVYDVGIDHGVLFIAMQLVEGPTFAAWRGADWREVVEKYLAAGEALAAAHAQDLVHRDFKPANVMLDARGVVKVLDFGLVRLVTGAASEAASASASASESESEAASESASASASASESASASASVGEPVGSAFDVELTATGTVLGTPAYMAPETFGGRRVDARGDQFSFCVALWEALYGERPYRGTNVHELRSMVTKGELLSPPRSDVPAAMQAVLRRGLRVEPADRWEDMRELLGALRRASGRGSTRVVIAGVAAAALIGGAFWLAFFDRGTACDDATAALGPTWDESRVQATEAAILGSGRAHALATWEHLRPRLDRWANDWIASHDAICRASHVDDTQSPALLDVRMACLERERDRVEAFLAVLGEGSEKAVRGAIAAAARLPSPNACIDAEEASDAASGQSHEVRARLADQRRQLAVAIARRHVGEYETALSIVLEVLAVARELGDAALAIDALLEESELRRGLGDMHRSEQSLRDAFLAAIGADDPVRATQAAVNLLFVIGIEFGRREESLEWYRHASAQLDRLPERDLGLEAHLLSTLGAVQGELGRLEESTASELQALALEREALGNDDVRLVPTLGNATAALINESRYDEALRLAEEAVAISEANLGPEHPDMTPALGVLARAAAAARQHDRSISAATRSLAIMEANYGADHLLTGQAVATLAAAHAQAGDHARALELVRRAIAILNAHFGPDHLQLAQLHELAADSLRSTGRFAEAADELRTSMAIAQKSLREDHPELAHSLAKLAAVTKQAGDIDEAIALYRRGLELTPPSPDHPQKSRSALLLGLAEALHDAKRWREADEMYASAIAEARITPGPASVMYLEAVAGRAATLLALDRRADARALLEPVRDAFVPPASDAHRRAQALIEERLAEASR